MAQSAGRPATGSRVLLEREAELAAAARSVDLLCGPRAGRFARGSSGYGARLEAGAGAHPGAGSVLAFTGPSGAGKTALLRETARRAADGGCTVLTAQGHEQEFAFHLVRSLLRTLCQGARTAGPGERGPCCDLRTALGRWYDIVAPALGTGRPTAALSPAPPRPVPALAPTPRAYATDSTASSRTSPPGMPRWPYSSTTPTGRTPPPWPGSTR